MKNSTDIVVIMPYTRPQLKDTTQTQTLPLNLVKAFWRDDADTYLPAVVFLPASGEWES